ncbi:DUF4625 domain-containing protein [Saccharicrinis fermentans]|uniref:DUF4625 domain-containing protein n=1 Tax=Saccharicrinis fermentans DSM 9555 = JCM 21142 TaxID=869213 RepID=W7YMK1_9BACT|nr:DUF4625 domain-containing protein [Saccharicrinis fermentans]GAF03609.1 hypothetical protein JCM21142_52287 [Saccharicrinis fermentans DSM 9555 = JCM 21142]
MKYNLINFKMMKSKLRTVVLFLAVGTMAVLTSCQNDDDIDDLKPEIDITIEDAFPAHCSDTIYFGEPFILKVRFTDNEELGSFSLDIHHNFDHHSHSTEFMECELDPEKNPVNPYTIIEEYDIPEGLEEYVTDFPITIPSSDASGLFDEGDYHFHISLTDKNGWSTQVGIGIKMAHR